MPWKHHHHRSSFLPSYQIVEDHFETSVSYDVVTNRQTPVLIHKGESEGNLCNITKNISINISVKPGVVENIHLGQNSSSLEQNHIRSFLGNLEMFSLGHMDKF